MNYLYKLLCCFNSLSAYFIEILIIILSLISIIVNILGLIIIPWKYTSSVMKILYIICLILLFFSLLISIFNLSSRNSKAKKNKMVHLAPTFLALLACILSLLIFIVIAIVMIPDLKNQHQIKKVQVLDPQTGEYHTKTSTDEKLVKNGKMTFVISSLIINIILLIFLIFLWISEYIRIKYNISGSYNEYLEETKNKLSEISKISTGNVAGHDKYGFPIYMKSSSNGGNFEVESSNLNYFNPISEKRVNYDKENYDVMKYSYKEKYGNNYQKPNNKSVDIIHRKYSQKEKYIDKYFENCEISQKYNNNYYNFTNKTILNATDANNSINPGK